MDISPQAIEIVQTYVTTLSGGWAGNTDAQILTAINVPSIANSASVQNGSLQGTVPAPYTFATLLSSLSQASAANVESFPGITQLYSDILSQNSVHVLATIALMAASGRIQSSEATAMTATVNATQADPTWPSQLSWAQVNLGRPADENDISTVRANL